MLNAIFFLLFFFVVVVVVVKMEILFGFLLVSKNSELLKEPEVPVLLYSVALIAPALATGSSFSWLLCPFNIPSLGFLASYLHPSPTRRSTLPYFLT